MVGGMRLNVWMEDFMKKGLFILLLTNVYVVYTAPLVQSITNKTQLGFEIISHTDTSACSAQLSSYLINSQSKFYNEFLVERGQPCLVLRPVYYEDTSTGFRISLVDSHKQFNFQNIHQAYELWKKAGNKRKFMNAEDWFNRWVGQDIAVRPHTNEIIGYLINLSRVHISNNIKEQGVWLSFAKGVFAKLVLEIDIDQHARKGIIPTIRVIPGEGGICSNGMIEYL